MEDKDLYTIAVLRYKEVNSGIKEEDLFPLDWYSNNNYHLKVEIIAEAIQRHILVKDTKLYNEKFSKICKELGR